VSHLAALLAFVVFLVLGARLRLAAPASRRRRVQALVAWVLGVHLLAVALTWDAWPFSSHTIAVGRVRGESPLCTTEVFGVDGAGREWRTDPYAFMPVYDSVLQYWWEWRGAALAPGPRQQALVFLWSRAEAARAAQASGRLPGPARWLGAAGAPYWLLLPRPEAVSPEPYRGLRLFRVCGLPRDRAADPPRVTRQLQAEWREP
jgi:hypothetical protein